MNFNGISNTKMDSKIKLYSLLFFILLTSSIEHIAMPLISKYFESVYFFVFVMTLQGCVFYFLMLVYYNGWNIKPKCPKINLITGSTNAIMSLCFVYSSSPTRTPVIIQSIFLGSCVIFSVIFTKYILKKKVTYEQKYTYSSIVLLCISVVISIVPMFNEDNFNKHTIFWMFGYLMAIICMSFDNIMQEKYMIITKDSSLSNKLNLSFYNSLVQFFMLFLLFPFDFAFGYNADPRASFAKGFYELFDNGFLLFIGLEFLVADFLILYLLSVKLNAISTNYNMIITNLTNQSVSLFFTIFPSLNSGVHSPFYVVIICIILNTVSIYLWIKGEKHDHDIQVPPVIPIIPDIPEYSEEKKLENTEEMV
jgi:hypothetical protein